MKKKKVELNKKLLLEKDRIATLSQTTGGVLYSERCANPTKETRCFNDSGGACGGDACFPTFANCKTMKIAGCDGGVGSLVGNCQITGQIPTNCGCPQSLGNC
jgi:hypothetical protein